MKPPASCCATCGSASIVKAGHNGSGTQQFLCKACGAHRVLKAKSTAIDPERKAMVLRAVEVERLSLRAAERVFGTARQNHRQVARKKAAGLPPLSETLLPAEKGDVLELDELWSFVGSKLNPALALDCSVSSDPPSGGLLRGGSVGRKRSCVA